MTGVASPASDTSPHARSPRNGRPRGHSSALEPIQERRRGSANNLAADIAAAALGSIAANASSAATNTSGEDSEYEEDDEPLEQVVTKESSSSQPSQQQKPASASATCAPIPVDGQKEMAPGSAVTSSPPPVINASPVPKEGTSAPSNLTAGLLKTISQHDASTSSGVSTPVSAAGPDSSDSAAGQQVAPVSEMQASFSDLKLSVNIASANAAPPLPAYANAHTSGKNLAGSFKSVSFSATNQTLQSDNTIRNTSTRVEIVTNAGGAGATQALPNVSTNAADFATGRTSGASGGIGGSSNGNSASSSNMLAGGTDIDVVDQYDTAARNINARSAASGGEGTAGQTVSGSLTGGAGSAFGAPVASFRANLHLEMSSLANSITLIPASPSASALGQAMGGVDGNSTFAHSLSQSRMSVRSYSSLAQESKVEAMVSSAVDNENGDYNDLQQELIEKAVVVIRRVMDKLTGLDFPDAVCNTCTDGSSSSHGSHSSSSNNVFAHHHQQQHALEVHDQVDRLIKEATSNENLSQSFFGWCPFW